MIVEIKGVQFVNKGAELMLHAVIQKLNEFDPSAEIVLAPNGNSPYKARAEVNAYQKLSLKKRFLDLNELSYHLPKKIRKWLKTNWGIVTEADVDVVLDASGFAYGDQWPTKHLEAVAKEVKRLAKHNKTFIFMPQALGPFADPEKQAAVKDGFSKAALIFAREQSSFDGIRPHLEDTSKLKIAPDFTNLVKGELEEDYAKYNNTVFIIPNYNMVNERNTNTTWKSRYLDFLVESVENIVELGYTPVLLNHEGKHDGELCEKVKAATPHPIEIIQETNPLKVKGLIGSSRGIICSRFHGCVSALTQGIPCVGTSWSHKYENLFAEYNRAEFLAKPEWSKEELKAALNSSISTVKEESYNTKIAEYKAQTKAMWDEIFKKIK
ncbi:polysaccharide pyruvyl transferase family protein [Vibrio alginolyticus]|uniref:Polysaccharide pyruvyl transferase family protein n=1 Tax=Vibrio alginolyticus TaxID=663 RepID=A0AA36XMX0_VIBAL|nr:polysaccharide pyruvyl transferase family protein [Vibrio alginolyticus]EGQ9134654.1 polysaccharide pyruvyl transferase family protein [Vibrio alginolyticus]EHD0129962.1 polysaccharide pyruvyl transferase family protein [Vibrio alginolyticus]ELB2895220.1 polysaccharide pyruvyl transferase family protein [Vibrio alginolyticus]MCR9886153.1 polysaccharide pyruvyl transferase family protein [Vibrio alginolyticus]MDL0444877.1 polysaccharide pyruvyl transferase family protein [Vibrio alginolyticu